MICPRIMQLRQSTHVLRNHIQKTVHTSQAALCEAKRKQDSNEEPGRDSDETFKEKGFGFPSDYLSKTRREIPTFADLKAKGLNVIKPALREIQYKLWQNLPNNLNDVQRLLQGFTPFLRDHYERGLRAVPDMNEIKSTPLPVFGFGCVGLIPFLLPTWRCMAAGCILPGWEFMQLAYGACVLSFVGGIRWGAILKDQRQMKFEPGDLGLGIVPPLMGLTSLSLPPFMGNVMLMAGLTIAAYIDLITPGFPNWYKVFRLGLTAVAVFSLFLTLFLKLILPRKQVAR